MVGGGYGGVGAGRIYCVAGGIGGALMTMVQIGAKLAPKHTDSQPKRLSAHRDYSRTEPGNVPTRGHPAKKWQEVVLGQREFS